MEAWFGVVYGKYAFWLSEIDEDVSVHARFGLSFEGRSIVEEWVGMPFENEGEGGSPTGANPTLVVQEKSYHQLNPSFLIMPYM
jgi:hypothetical protein